MSTTQPIRSLEQLHLFKNYYKSEKPNARNYVLITVGLNTALRISDILNLTYGDIYNFPQNKWKSHITIHEQKTGKINRIFINKEIHTTLDSYIDPLSHKPNDWLFASRGNHDKPLSRYQAYRLIREAADYAGLENNISCHSLRKTFGYHAWRQGTSSVLLMNIYNHSSFQITKRYLGIEQDDKDAVFEKIVL